MDNFASLRATMWRVFELDKKNLQHVAAAKSCLRNCKETFNKAICFV